MIKEDFIGKQIAKGYKTLRMGAIKTKYVTMLINF